MGRERASEGKERGSELRRKTESRTSWLLPLARSLACSILLPFLLPFLLSFLARVAGE